jgi:hypothetical protein
MTQDEINAVKKAAEKMRKESAQNEIIDMARQAEIDIGMWEKLSDNDDVFGYDFCGTHENLEAFAKLVAAKEREACAEIAEKQRYAFNISLTTYPEQNGTAVGIANAIRARGEA